MTFRRLAILTGVVAALFAFILLFERRMPTTQQRLEKGDVLWDINEGKLAKMSILRGGETLEFVRGGDESWRLVKPIAYPAESGMLSSLVFDLARPAREGEAAKSSSQPDFGLMSPRAVVTVTAKAEAGGEPETHTLSIGTAIPGTDSVAARVQGENRIVFVRSALATDVLKPLDEFKSKKIFDGLAADVASLAVVRGRGRLDFERRKDVWWMAHPLADLGDATAITRLIGDLVGANVSQFVAIAPGDLSGDGLQPPIFTVSMTVKKRTTTLEIGATRSDGKSVYARANGQTFALDSSITDELAKEADAYREKKLVRFDNFDVKSLSMTSGSQTRAFAKVGPEWKEADKIVPATAVTDVLTALGAIVGKDFVPLPSSRSGADGAATVRLETTTGASWTIDFLPGAPQHLTARVSGRPDGIAIDPGDLDRIKIALARVVPQPAAKAAAPAPKPAAATPKK